MGSYLSSVYPSSTKVNPQPQFSPQPLWPVVLDNVDFPAGEILGQSYPAATTDIAWNTIIENQLLLYPNQIAVYYKTLATPVVKVKNWDQTTGYSSNTGAMTFFIPQMRWNALNTSTSGNFVHQQTLYYLHRRSDGTTNLTVMELNSSNTGNAYRINADGTVQSTLNSTKYLWNSAGAIVLHDNKTFFDYDLFVSSGLLRDTDTGKFVIPNIYPTTSGTALVLGDTPKVADMFQFR